MEVLVQFWDLLSSNSALCRYKPQRNFNGHITLIRAEHGAAREEDVGRDYGISKVDH